MTHKIYFTETAKYVCNKWCHKVQKAIIFPAISKCGLKQRKHNSKMYAYIKAGREKLHQILMQPLIIQSTARQRSRSLSHSNLFSHSRHSQQRKRARAHIAFQRRGVGVRGVGISALEEKLASRTMTRILFTACAPKVQRERREGSGGGVRHVLSRGLLRRMCVCVENVSTRQTHV